MNGLTHPYSPFAFQPHVILRVPSLGAWWDHCPSLELCLFKPKAVITLQKTLFLQGGRGRPDGWHAHGHKKGPCGCSCLLESPFVYKAEEQHLKIYTREKSAREEADYPVAACFPKCFAFLRNPNLLLLASHYKAWKESGWSRPLSHKKGKRILTGWSSPSWKRPQRASGVGRKESFHI